MDLTVYLETGQKKTFAGSVEWPGWCRAGKDKDEALDMLLTYAARYARALDGSGLAFAIPSSRAGFEIVERHKGSGATDFGVPAAVPAADAKLIDAAQLLRYEAVLQACWRAFDQAAEDAAGIELRKGPRGGGRTLEKITEHVIAADEAYLRQLGWKFKLDPGSSKNASLAQIRAAILEGLSAAARGEVPSHGPRGGLRWPPRYFVRRAAWHILDHAWEIEDRAAALS